MSVGLNIGDAVLVNTRNDSEAIGVIKYIGCIDGCDMMTEYVGIELIEAIDNGHTGSIDGYQYFSSPNGHGFHTKLTNVIRKILPLELITQIRKMLQLFTNKLIEKDKYIQQLQNIHNGSSKSLRLTSCDSNSGHISRRDSSSTSISNNLHNMTAIASMTPITENNNDMNFSNLDSICDHKKTSSMSSDSTTTATRTDNECSSSAISSQYDSNYIDDDESKWRKTKRMKKMKRRKKKGMKIDKDGSRNINKSNRKDSIIKATQNMQQIRNNIIKRCNGIIPIIPNHANIAHQSTPTVFISPITSNNSNNNKNGVHLYDGNNPLSPNHPNAILLDPPSPNQSNQSHYFYNGQHSFSNLHSNPSQIDIWTQSISPHTPNGSIPNGFHPTNIKYNNMIPSLSAMSTSSLSAKRTGKRTNKPSVVSFGISSQSTISPHIHYDDISNNKHNKMYSLSNIVYHNNNISK